VTIDSQNDRFDDNLIGGLILGGQEGMGATVSNDNVVNLTMHAGSMARNRGVLLDFSGGLSVVGGSATTAGSTSRQCPSRHRQSGQRSPRTCRHEPRDDRAVNRPRLKAAPRTIRGW
jgi:hypothetical protein